MGKKMMALVGIGAGYLLARKELRENPEGPVATVINKVRTNSTVERVSSRAKEKTGEAVRRQGEVITDKIADAVKERLFGAPTQKTREPEIVDIDIEDISDSTSTRQW